MSEFSGYTRSVTVEYVKETFVPPLEGGPTDHKKITVTVSFDGGAVSLTTIRSNY